MLTAGAGGSIEMRGLTKIYGSERVVDAFDARIAAGEFFSLLGPSGSGKTTTLMMVAGFAPIDEGELIVDGRDLSAVPPERRGFGMVFQNYAIFPHLDVFENVAFPLRARGVPKAKVRERVAWALDLVQLRHVASRYSRQLSGGQQQRVAIARAIVFQPGIVLMDEPLGALDKNLRYEMQVEIKEIQQRLGMTVIYVTHDQEEAMNLSDRIAILNRGRIEQMGAPRDIYEHPANAFTARFLGEANLVLGTVLEAGSGEAVFRLRGGEVLRARSQDKLAAGLEAQLFVRPEKLVLSRPGEESVDCRNRLLGRVRRISFLGNTVRYAIELGTGASLTVDAQNLSDGFRPAVGDEVAVAWKAADSSILKADAR
jgi:spermidine/putrescine ABC transporter ATP-binding subunit